MKDLIEWYKSTLPWSDNVTDGEVIANGLLTGVTIGLILVLIFGL